MTQSILVGVFPKFLSKLSLQIRRCGFPRPLPTLTLLPAFLTPLLNRWPPACFFVWETQRIKEIGDIRRKS